MKKLCKLSNYLSHQLVIVLLWSIIFLVFALLYCICFEDIIYCSSPNIPDALKSIEPGSNTHTGFDFNSIDKLMSDMKNNLELINKNRVDECNAIIENNKKFLQNHLVSTGPQLSENYSKLVPACQNINTNNLTHLGNFVEIAQQKFTPVDPNSSTY